MPTNNIYDTKYSLMQVAEDVALFMEVGSKIEIINNYPKWTWWQHILGWIVGRSEPLPEYVRVVEIIDRRTIKVEPWTETEE